MVVLRGVVRLLLMGIHTMGWLGITVVFVGPVMAVVVFGGRCTGHSRWYWRWVACRLAPFIFWWKRVRVSQPDAIAWTGVTEGLFSCVSVVDVLVVLRLIPNYASLVYQPMRCPWWLVMIFEKCGVYPLHMVPDKSNIPIWGVAPPHSLVVSKWDSETIQRWLESPATQTVCIQVRGTNMGTDWRSWLVCIRPKQVTVIAKVMVWPELVNPRRRTETRTRQLTEAWDQLQA